MRTVSWLLALAGLLLARPAPADPRWWWDDLRITDNPQASLTPHLVAPGYATGGAGGQAVFLTWAEVDPAGGDLEIWTTATFDQGCTFCRPVRVTDNAVDDTNPRIAVLGLPTGFWSVALAFESADGVVIAWDSQTAPFRVPFDQLCPGYEAVGPAMMTNDQYVRFAEPGAVLAAPDLESASTQLWGHFHAVWTRTGAVSSEIQTAHDLTAMGGAGWRLDPPKTVMSSDPASTVGEPALAADILTDPDPITGLPTMDRSGVSLAWTELLPTDQFSLVATRSVDSGATFSPTGARADAPAAPLRPIGPPVTSGAHAPALDSGANTFSTTQPTWVVAAWYERHWPGQDEVVTDARLMDTPATAAPDWQDPDVVVSPVSARVVADPSVAVAGGFNPAPAVWLTRALRTAALTEIAVRGGVLDAAAPDPVGWSRPPLDPQRPGDLAISRDDQLTHCAFDAATFSCLPTRTSGTAEDAEIDANEFAAYVAWSDTRDGNAEIYFKRTDRFVTPVTPRLTAACGALGDATITVELDPIATCPTPFAGERMGRYLVHVATAIGGPFDVLPAPAVVAHDPLASPLAVTITGLAPGTDHRVLVVPEDQARNLAPANFDPGLANGFAWPGEVGITTPTPCVAPPVCLYRSDVIDLDPLTPPATATYLVPPTALDVHLQGAAYQCPFSSGDLEPDATALRNGIPLVLYQVDRPLGTLRLAPDGPTIRFSF